MASDIVIVLGIVLLGAYFALQYYETRRRIKLQRKKRDAKPSENNP